MKLKCQEDCQFEDTLEREDRRRDEADPGDKIPAFNLPPLP